MSYRPSTRLITGNALAELRKMPAASFDAVLCDPPYGLTSGKKGGSGPASVNLDHPGGRARVTTGFMGMAWDGMIPGTEVWAEVLRALKPGAPLLAFGGTRTYHRLACAIEDAGFIISDTLCWLHGQGFPKGHAQLKPAWEPITLAWKKGKRALAIDAARIPANGESLGGGQNTTGRQAAAEGWRRPWMKDERAVEASIQRASEAVAKAESQGRWPANVLLDGTAAAALDLQSGTLTSGNNPAVRHSPKTRDIYGLGFGDQCLVRRPTNSGGASRFFYCAKASRSERGEGNTHPTVKPLKLLEYLARLILPPVRETPRRLLVPFSGSGSELLAARSAGWDEAVGIEIDPRYVRMARSRLGILEAPVSNRVQRTAKISRTEQAKVLKATA